MSLFMSNNIVSGPYEMIKGNAQIMNKSKNIID
jgi:hypothetical protein